MKILVADDDMMLQNVYKTFVNRLGYDVDVAVNGLEAVEYAKRNNGKYDLCLMDIEMPKMNGIEALKIIRRDVQYFPIMGLSSSFMKRGMHSNGLDDFLAKPFYPKELMEKINELIIKSLKIEINNNEIYFKYEVPLDGKELKELIDFKKKGLTKLKLPGNDSTFLVHKNIQNKISHDFIDDGKEISEFIDRTPNEEGICHLYKADLMVKKVLFGYEELERALMEEDALLKKFKSVSGSKIEK